jgi:hypothetical protein
MAHNYIIYTIVFLKFRLKKCVYFKQPVYFKPGSEEDALLKVEKSDSTLLAWFKLNQNDDNAH